MTISVQSATSGTQSIGQQLVAGVKWCGKEISQGFKSHIVPASKTIWARALAFLSTGIGAGITAMIVGFCVVSYAASQSNKTAQVALCLLGIAMIVGGIASIAVVGPAALI